MPYEYIRTSEEFQTVIDHLEEYIKFPKAKLAVDLETYSLSGEFPKPIKKVDGSYQGYISTLQIGLDPEITDTQFIIDMRVHGVEFASQLKPYLENSVILGQSLKYEWGFLKVFYDIDLGKESDTAKGLRDTLLISQVFFAGDKIKHSLSNLYKEFLPFSWFKAETGMTFKEYEEHKEKMQQSSWGAELTLEQLQYAADDVRLIFYLYKAQLDALDKWRNEYEKGFPSNKSILEVIKLECNLIPIFAIAEIEGMKYDKKYQAEHVIPYLERKLVEADDEIGKFFTKGIKRSNGRRGRFREEWIEKETINAGSHVQIRECLIPFIPELAEKDKKGDFVLTTGEADLTQFVDRHPAVASILQYKKASSLLSKFGQKMIDLCGEGDYLRPRWFQMGDENNSIDTGRSSCSGPNLMQIVSRGTLFDDVKASTLFRTAFIVESDEVMIRLDLSNIEPRLMAEIYDDEVMLDAFGNDKDMHSITAKVILDLDYYPKDGEYERDFIGKTFKLMSDYQAGAKKQRAFMLLHGRGKINPDDWTLEATKLRMEKYFQLYSGVKRGMMEMDRSIRRKSEMAGDSLAPFAGRKPFAVVQSELGRPRRFCLTQSQERLAKEFPESLSKNYWTYNEEGKPSKWNEYAQKLSQASREGFNSRIQGTAADLLKLSEWAIYRRLKREGFTDAKIIGFIHDELLIKCKCENGEKVLQIAHEEMVRAGRRFITKIPCKVAGKIGRNWAEAK